MERLGYTGYSLSKALETSEAVVSNIRNGKNPPNVLLIRALLNKHEDVDADWLLSGKGRMFKTGGMGHEPVALRDTGGMALLTSMNDRLERIEMLLEKMNTLQVERDVVVDESISDLERTVRTLEKDVQEVRKDRRRKP